MRSWGTDVEGWMWKGWMWRDGCGGDGNSKMAAVGVGYGRC